jgi:hypothetical protein
MASDTSSDNGPSARAHETLGFEIVDRCINFRKAQGASGTMPPSSVDWVRRRREPRANWSRLPRTAAVRRKSHTQSVLLAGWEAARWPQDRPAIAVQARPHGGVPPAFGAPCRGRRLLPYDDVEVALPRHDLDGRPEPPAVHAKVDPRIGDAEPANSRRSSHGGE